uniref:PRC-barrel domain-containing protein n=2 Tax=Alcaligenaceae TaxID=506 RepID=UPI00359FBFEC
MEHQSNIVGGPKARALGPGPEVMAANTLEGNDVYNAAGESLGDVKAIMID